MPRWTCPRCDREFARAKQSHTCVPGCTVDATFAGRPPQQRQVYDALLRYLTTLGPVHEDAVSVGVFLKRERKLAEVRPRSADVLVLLFLPYPVENVRIRPMAGSRGARIVHRLPLRGPDEVDDDVLDWLTIAYHDASD
ncbi:MAG TPA: DUF5655 domain-containing protein [Streptosporangiales bacterium]